MDADTVMKAARLAGVYGDDWNALSQADRAAYIRCIEAIECAAAPAQPDGVQS